MGSKFQLQIPVAAVRAICLRRAVAERTTQNQLEAEAVDSDGDASCRTGRPRRCYPDDRLRPRTGRADAQRLPEASAVLRPSVQTCGRTARDCLPTSADGNRSTDPAGRGPADGVFWKWYSSRTRFDRMIKTDVQRPSGRPLVGSSWLALDDGYPSPRSPAHTGYLVVSAAHRCPGGHPLQVRLDLEARS